MRPKPVWSYSLATSYCSFPNHVCDVWYLPHTSILNVFFSDLLSILLVLHAFPFAFFVVFDILASQESYRRGYLILPLLCPSQGSVSPASSSPAAGASARRTTCPSTHHSETPSTECPTIDPRESPKDQHRGQIPALLSSSVAACPSSGSLGRCSVRP